MTLFGRWIKSKEEIRNSEWNHNGEMVGGQKKVERPVLKVDTDENYVNDCDIAVDE